MRVVLILVTGLFDRFEHRILLNQQERITIIHGPNGVGKTTVLRMLHDLFTRHYVRLGQFQFADILVKFDDGSTLFLRKSSASQRPRDVEFSITYEGPLGRADAKFKPLVHARRSSRSRRLGLLEEYLPWLERFGPERWADPRSSEILTLHQVVERYGHILPPELSKGSEAVPPLIEHVLGQVQTHFIQTQRLFSRKQVDPRRSRREAHEADTTVEQYAVEMADLIQEKLRASGSLAASLDSTFPQRLLAGQIPPNVEESTIRERYRSQTDYRNRLMTAGLIEQEHQLPLPESELNEYERKVLWYYLDDVDRKFETFDKLLKKVELFTDIINKRFLYKHLTIDKESGFRFVTDEGRFVPPRSLSSGEQHELVLAFELLFKVSGGSLILIDEPELSLHVTWQHKFLEDIQRISEIGNLDFIIATHSPSIIRQRRDLMVELGNSEPS